MKEGGLECKKVAETGYKINIGMLREQVMAQSFLLILSNKITMLAESLKVSLGYVAAKAVGPGDGQALKVECIVPHNTLFRLDTGKQMSWRPNFYRPVGKNGFNQEEGDEGTHGARWKTNITCPEFKTLCKASLHPRFQNITLCKNNMAQTATHDPEMKDQEKVGT